MAKQPQWKNRKTKSEKRAERKEKRFKEARPKHVRPTQNEAWKRLNEWFRQVRYNTLVSCGLTEEEIRDYMKNKDTNYYENRNSREHKDYKKASRKRASTTTK